MRELAKAKQEMAVLRLEHQRLSAKLQEYSIFNKYLEKVVENSEVCGGLGPGRGRASAALPPHPQGPGLGTLCSGERSPAKEGSWQRALVRLDSFLKGGALVVHLCVHDVCGPVCMGHRFEVLFWSTSHQLCLPLSDVVHTVPASPPLWCFWSTLRVHGERDGKRLDTPASCRAGHLAYAGPWAACCKRKLAQSAR